MHNENKCRRAPAVSVHFVSYSVTVYMHQQTYPNVISLYLCMHMHFVCVTLIIRAELALSLLLSVTETNHRLNGASGDMGLISIQKEKQIHLPLSLMCAHKHTHKPPAVTYYIMDYKFPCFGWSKTQGTQQIHFFNLHSAHQ